MTCIHCERDILYEDGRWIDPLATGDDSIWRETCEGNDTFQAPHEPAETAPCTDCGKQVAIAEIEDLSGERCPAQPPSENGIKWGHRIARADYDRLAKSP